MNGAKKEVIGELEKISAEAREKFGAFSTAQLSWQPAAESWSIGQCFAHLIVSNEMFFGDFDRIADGTRRNSLLETYSPLSAFFGRLLIDSLKKDSRKSKTVSAAAPPGEIAPGIIEKFAAHQAKLIDKTRRAETTDQKKIKLTSPFLKIATYSLEDAFQIIAEHEKRHFRQAARVLEAPNFPK